MPTPKKRKAVTDKISMAVQSDRTAVHLAREHDVIGGENARTICCGALISASRFYPLLWSESMRLVTCHRATRRTTK
jgi:hypothetical protein